MISIQNYARVQSLEEAYELNQVKANRIIGGMLWLKVGSGRVETAIDLSDLGLNKIEETDGEFSIGAMVTLRQLETHKGLNAYSNDSVRNAVKDIIGVQFRNLATVGGSIWGRYGFSDVLTVFLAMDTYVELYKGGLIPLEEFASRKPDRDVLVRIVVKKTPAKVVYSAVRIQRTDFPVLTCAVSKVAEEYRAVIGARPARAIVIRDAENTLSSGISPESAAAFGDYVARNTPTGNNMRGSGEYRTHLTSVLTRRNLLQIGGLT